MKASTDFALKLLVGLVLLALLSGWFMTMTDNGWHKVWFALCLTYSGAGVAWALLIASRGGL